MVWSQKARDAAALARKRKSGNKSAFKNKASGFKPKNVPPSINLAQSSTTKHKPGERTSKSGRATYKAKPSKAIGSQSSPVAASKPGKPMKAAGVAKPTGPHAFTGGAKKAPAKKPFDMAKWQKSQAKAAAKRYKKLSPHSKKVVDAYAKKPYRLG